MPLRTGPARRHRNPHEHSCHLACAAQSHLKVRGTQDGAHATVDSTALAAEVSSLIGEYYPAVDVPPGGQYDVEYRAGLGLPLEPGKL